MRKRATQNAFGESRRAVDLWGDGSHFVQSECCDPCCGFSLAAMAPSSASSKPASGTLVRPVRKAASKRSPASFLKTWTSFAQRSKKTRTREVKAVQCEAINCSQEVARVPTKRQPDLSREATQVRHLCRNYETGRRTDRRPVRPDRGHARDWMLGRPMRILRG